MKQHLQFWLSAECVPDAQVILEELTATQLIVGGSIIKAPSRFWWKGEQVELSDYCYVMGFTIIENRERVEIEYAKLSKEEIPMASFVEIAGNERFLHYIQSNCKRAE